VALGLLEADGGCRRRNGGGGNSGDRHGPAEGRHGGEKGEDLRVVRNGEGTTLPGTMMGYADRRLTDFAAMGEPSTVHTGGALK